MLEVTALRRCYGSVCAVDDTSFSVARGEIVGLLGHNGAGKTTIMRMLSGALEPDQGQVHIDGIDLAADAEAAQSRIGYLPENLPVYPELSVVDYLEYIAQMRRLSEAEKYEEIRRVLRETDIEDKSKAVIGTLSRGYKQRVGVAQALLGKPSLLILDEPTNGLDPTQTHHMRSLIRSLAETATVLLSTHIMQEVDAICHRVLILSAGRLVVDERLVDLRYSHELLLTTDMTAERAKADLQSLPGVRALLQVEAEASIPAGDGAHTYRITLDESAPLATTSGDLARKVVTSGSALYSLHPVQCDLETVFREASTSSKSEEV